MSCTQQPSIVREEAMNSVDFSLLGEHLQPVIEETLKEQGKNRERKGTFFTSNFTFYAVICLCINRDLNQNQVINWLISVYRWCNRKLEPKVVAEGTLTHARKRLGVKIFREVFHKLIGKTELPVDFHGRSTVGVDGTTGSMLDTPENRETFGRASIKKRETNNKSAEQVEGTGFPRMRIVTFLSLPLRKILGVESAPYTGKETGERSLFKRILARFRSNVTIVFLFDAGFYAFDLFKSCSIHEHDFIIKVPSHIKFKKKTVLRDGSYYAVIKKGSEELMVRVISYKIRGFRASRLITSILEPQITALELAMHYHQRWDVETAFHELKVRQCAVLNGHPATTFRSKIPELVMQELYAQLIAYNAIRDMMYEAAILHNKDPRKLSFSNTLAFIIESFQYFCINNALDKSETMNYLLYLISESEIDRPRRRRVNPRVVKVKSSKFERKNDFHKSELRNLQEDLNVLPEAA